MTFEVRKFEEISKEILDLEIKG